MKSTILSSMDLFACLAHRSNGLWAQNYQMSCVQAWYILHIQTKVFWWWRGNVDGTRLQHHILQRGKKLLPSDVPMSSCVITKNADSFLHDIVTFFKSYSLLQDRLIGALIQVIAMKMKGHKNPCLPSVVMMFFRASQLLSPWAFDFVSASIFGPCQQTILCYDANERSPSMICIENHELELNLTEHLTKLPRAMVQVYFNLCWLWWSKSSREIGIIHCKNSIIGGSYPNYLIDINGNLRRR